MDITYSIIGKAVSWAVLLPLGLVFFGFSAWLLYIGILGYLESKEWFHELHEQYLYTIRGRHLPTEWLREKYRLGIKKERTWILLYRLRNINRINKMHRK